MKFIHQVILLFIGCGFSILRADAQLKARPTTVKPDSSHMVISSVSHSADPEPAKTHLDAEFKYLSDQVYMGRRDSTVLPYYIPTLSYFHKSGLYASASLNYLKNSTDSRIDLVTLEAGYDFNKGKYEGKLSFTQFFYNSQSTSVTSELNSAIAFENNFDLGFLKPTLTGSLDLGSALDFVLSLGVSHEFSLVNDKLDLTPSLGMNIASQNNYNEYYKNKKLNASRSGHGPPGNSSAISGKIINANSFQIKDYELSMPVSYSLGKCSFNFTATYAMPVNPAMVEVQTTTNGNSSTVIGPEKLSNIFYWDLGVTYTF
jgi:hypothetical protein